ncbi:hypothetical protein Tco_0718446 [Tanacetum coccineum]
MKAVKEKEQLQKTLDSWKDSSKNLWRLIASGMSSNSKVGLGFEIQSNNEVLSYEEEMNFSVFKCSKEDSIGKPVYSRFTKTNDFKGVPHPLSGDYTPKPQEEIDDSLYVYGKKGPQKPEISVSDDNSSEHSVLSIHNIEELVNLDCQYPIKTSNSSTSQKTTDESNEVKEEIYQNHIHLIRNPFAKTTAQMSHAKLIMGRTSTEEHGNDIFDSGASGHMTGHKESTEDLKELTGGSVTLEIARLHTVYVSEEKDEEVELIVVPSAVKTPEEKDESRKSSTNSKKEETLTEPQKEKKDSSTDSLEDNPKI